MASTIKLVQGDNRPYIKLTLTNADGTVVDVSAGTTTVVVKLRAVGGTTILSTLSCSKPNGGADGVVMFNFPASTLSVPAGSYEGEIEMSFNGEIQTIYEKLRFSVREQF